MIFDDDEFAEVIGEQSNAEFNQEHLIKNKHVADTQSPSNGNVGLNVSNGQQLLLDNPELKRLFNQMIDERIKATQQGETSNSTLLSTTTPKSADKATTGKQRTNFNKGVKSPSDTTIYVPALAQRSMPRGTLGNIGSALKMLRNRGESLQIKSGSGDVFDNSAMIDQISTFVDEVRAEQSSGVRASEVVVPGRQQALKRGENSILEAEKFKAVVATPPGRNDHIFLSNQEPVVGCAQVSCAQESKNDLDDAFIHIISHIDQSMKTKIENGEYVDLDKLLPKERHSMSHMMNDFEQLEWVRGDSGTFLVPAQN